MKRKRYRRSRRKPPCVAEFAESKWLKARRSARRMASHEGLEAAGNMVADVGEGGVGKMMKYGGAVLGTKLAGPVGTVAGSIAGAQVGAKAERDIARSSKKGKIDTERFNKRYKKERQKGKSKREATMTASNEVAKKSGKTWKTMRKSEKWRAQQGKGKTFAGKVTEGLIDAVPGADTAKRVVRGTKGFVDVSRAIGSRGQNKFRHQLT